MADLKLTIDVEAAKADLQKALKQMRDMANKPIEAKLKVNDKQITSTIKKLEKLRTAASSIGAGATTKDFGKDINKGISDSTKNTEKQVRNSTQKIKSYYNELLSAQKKVDKIVSNTKGFQENKHGYKTPEIDNQIAKLESVKKQLVEAQNLYKNAEMTGKEFVPDKTAETHFQNLIQKADTYKRELDVLNTSVERANKVPETMASKMRTFDKLGNRMTAYFKQYEKEITRNEEIYSKYRTTLAKLNSGQYATSADANNAFASFRMEARKAGIEVESFGAKLEKTFGARVRSALAGQGVFLMQSALQDIVKNAIDVDTAMTEVKKVTNETDSTYAKFLNNAGNRASNIGATLTEVINATADYARLGYSLEEATGLADSALIYSNVGDDVASIDDATGSLISTMQGFNIAASDSMQIVDKFNNV